MANEVIYPDLNPVKLVDMNPTAVPQYLTKHFENYRFQDQQYSWNQLASYDQKWQTSDIIYFQFESNYDPIEINLIDCFGITRISLLAVQKMENKWEPGKYVYEASMSLAGLSDGRYFVKVPLNDVVLISEPILIKQVHPNSILHQYNHRRFHGEIIFETGIVFQFRVECTIGKIKPGTKDVLYEDEPLNPTLLSSKSFRAFPLSYGGPKGLPDWMIDRINNIWTCSDVMLDGKSFAKTTESKLELKESERYPMRGITMEVREGINRGSKIIKPSVDTNKRLLIAGNIEGKLFGDLFNLGSSNIIPINIIE